MGDRAGFPPPVHRSGLLAERMAKLLLDGLDELTDRLVADILAENPGYHDAALVPLDELRHSCHENLHRVLQILGGSVPPPEDPFDAATATGARRAEQKAPLDAVLRSYRLGGRVIWRGLVELAKDDAEVERDQLLDLATSVWTVVDEASSAVARSYRRTELQIRRLDEHRRHALVEDLLRGRGREPGFAGQAAVELDLPAGSSYLVVVAETAADGTPGLAGPQDILTIHGIRSVWELRAQTTVGLIGLERHQAAEVLGLLRAAVRARAGAGPAVPGLGEVGSAHELAVLALRTLPPGRAGLAELDEQLPAALVARSPELAARLLDGVLGPVLALAPAEREALLDTLDAWLATNKSAAATANRLYCHRNTVLNRLNRLESALGRSIHSSDGCLTLSLALIAYRLRRDGSAAQPGPEDSGRPA